MGRRLRATVTSSATPAFRKVGILGGAVGMGGDLSDGPLRITGLSGLARKARCGRMPPRSQEHAKAPQSVAKAGNKFIVAAHA